MSLRNVYSIWYFPGTALITNLLSKTENDDKNISFEVTDVQSTTALSVMYNSEYINGVFYQFFYIIFIIRKKLIFIIEISYSYNAT